MRLCDSRLVQGDRRRSCHRSGGTLCTGPDEPEETGHTTQNKALCGYSNLPAHAGRDSR